MPRKLNDRDVRRLRHILRPSIIVFQQMLDSIETLVAAMKKRADDMLEILDEFFNGEDNGKN